VLPPFLIDRLQSPITGRLWQNTKGIAVQIDDVFGQNEQIFAR
jgi:hypothetical protein